MSTSSVTYADIAQVQRAPSVRWITILITISLILMIVAILAIVLSTTREQDSFQADLIPVVKNSITPVPVPMPPLANIHASPSGTPTPALVGTSKLSVLPVSVPTPPISNSN